MWLYSPCFCNQSEFSLLQLLPLETGIGFLSALSRFKSFLSLSASSFFKQLSISSSVFTMSTNEGRSVGSIYEKTDNQITFIFFTDVFYRCLRAIMGFIRTNKLKPYPVLFITNSANRRVRNQQLLDWDAVPQRSDYVWGVIKLCPLMEAHVPSSILTIFSWCTKQHLFSWILRLDHYFFANVYISQLSL